NRLDTVHMHSSLSLSLSLSSLSLSLSLPLSLSRLTSSSLSSLFCLSVCLWGLGSLGDVSGLFVSCNNVAPCVDSLCDPLSPHHHHTHTHTHTQPCSLCPHKCY